MAKLKYYALAGVDGYGVYNNWCKVVHDREYVKRHKFKKFSTYGDAKEYAEAIYDRYQCGAEEGRYCIDEITKVNVLYQRRENISYYEPEITPLLVKPFTINV